MMETNRDKVTNEAVPNELKPTLSLLTKRTTNVSFNPLLTKIRASCTQFSHYVTKISIDQSSCTTFHRFYAFQQYHPLASSIFFQVCHRSLQRVESFLSNLSIIRFAGYVHRQRGLERGKRKNRVVRWVHSRFAFLQACTSTSRGYPMAQRLTSGLPRTLGKNAVFLSFPWLSSPRRNPPPVLCQSVPLLPTSRNLFLPFQPANAGNDLEIHRWNNSSTFRRVQLISIDGHCFSFRWPPLLFSPTSFSFRFFHEVRQLLSFLDSS